MKNSKRWFVSCLVFLLVLTSVLSACGKKERTAKEVLLEGMATSANMDSFRFEGGMTYQFTVPSNLLESDPMAGSMAQLIENARVDIDGIYQRDPFQLEANLNLHFTGDMAITITVPFVLNEETLWIRIPQIPLLPIPPDATGKYLQLELEELGHSMSTSTMDPEQIFDVNKQQEFGMQMLERLVQQYDEETYFSVLTSEQLKSQLPNQQGAEVAVQFAIEEDQWKDAISILVNDVLPEWVELISQPEWTEWLQLESGDIERMREKVKQEQENWAQNSAELDEDFQLNEFVIQMALDDNDYPVYFQTLFDVVVFELGEPLPASISIEMQFDEINESPPFEIGIPNEDETLTTDEFMQLFLMGY